MRFEKRNAIAYRMALVAAGAFDAAINLSPKWDWAVCAGALIVEEAGGRVTDHHGHAWRFNQADPRQNSLVWDRQKPPRTSAESLISGVTFNTATDVLLPLSCSWPSKRR